MQHVKAELWTNLDKWDRKKLVGGLLNSTFSPLRFGRAKAENRILAFASKRCIDVKNFKASPHILWLVRHPGFAITCSRCVGVIY